YPRKQLFLTMLLPKHPACDQREAEHSAQRNGNGSKWVANQQHQPGEDKQGANQHGRIPLNRSLSMEVLRCDTVHANSCRRALRIDAVRICSRMSVLRSATGQAL